MSGKLNLNIGQTVRTIRQDAGASMHEMGAQSGDVLSENMLSKLERGQARWNADTIEAAAVGLKMSVPALLRRIADDMDGVSPETRGLHEAVERLTQDGAWLGLAAFALLEGAREEHRQGAHPAELVELVVGIASTAAQVAVREAIDGPVREVAKG